MASGKIFNSLEENDEGSNDSILNFDSSSEPKPEDKSDNCGFSESCPAVMEPSKDESRRSDGRSKNLLRQSLTRSCPLPSTTELSTSSNGESGSPEDSQETSVSTEESQREPDRRNERQTDEPQTNCCITFLDCYNKYKHMIGISWFIFVFQIFIGLVAVSAIVMGIIYYNSCDGQYSSTNPFLTILLGISALFLVYKWMVKVCRQRRGEYFWDHEKNRLIMYFFAVMFILSIECIFFSQMKPKILQSRVEVECDKTYYDYLYYMHITSLVCLVFAALLYFPDCCIYVYSYQRVQPSNANGHYQPL